MSNPYQSPLGDPFAGRQSPADERQRVLAAVQGPAVGLVVVSIISVGLLALTIPFDILLLITGGIGHLNVDEAKALQIAVRLIWSLAILAASGYCLYGAWQMKSLKNYQHARNASLIAVIPCLGPCCLLGIPFGAWALTVLSRPEIRSRFES